MTAADEFLMLIVSSPSGAGKTTLCTRLRHEFPELRFSVSHTTRKPRPNEQDGREYHFVDQQAFEAMANDGAFAEWASVHGRCYGTAMSEIEQARRTAGGILFDIDFQGARQIRARMPDAVAVFILPPSLEELEARLRGRGTDSDDVIMRRLLGARGEMRHVGEFDYVILNNALQCAIDDLVAVVRASRLRYANQHARHLQYFNFLEQD